MSSEANLGEEKAREREGNVKAKGLSRKEGRQEGRKEEAKVFSSESYLCRSFFFSSLEHKDWI